MLITLNCFNIKLMKNELLLSFVRKLDLAPEYYVESSGRFEVIGNHTDHNGGLCVSASCDLKIKGYLARRDAAWSHRAHSSLQTPFLPPVP